MEAGLHAALFEETDETRPVFQCRKQKIVHVGILNAIVRDDRQFNKTFCR